MSDQNIIYEIYDIIDDITYLENKKNIELDKFDKISKDKDQLIDEYHRILNNLETQIYNLKCQLSLLLNKK